MISATDAIAALPQVLLAGQPVESEAPEWVPAFVCRCGAVIVLGLESPHAHTRHCVGFLSFQHDQVKPTG